MSEITTLEHVKEIERLLFVARYKEVDNVFSQWKFPLDIFKIVFKDVKGGIVVREWRDSPSEDIRVIEKIKSTDEMTITQKQKQDLIKGPFHVDIIERMTTVTSSTSHAIKADDPYIYELWEHCMKYNVDMLDTPGPFAEILTDKDNFIRYFKRTNTNNVIAHIESGSYISDMCKKWNNDKEFLIQVICKATSHNISSCADDFALVDKEWMTNKQFCLRILEHRTDYFFYFDKSLTDDKECVMAMLNCDIKTEGEYAALKAIMKQTKATQHRDVCVLACSKGWMQHCRGGSLRLESIVPDEFANEKDIILASAEIGTLCECWIALIKNDSNMLRTAIGLRGQNLHDYFRGHMINSELLKIALNSNLLHVFEDYSHLVSDKDIIVGLSRNFKAPPWVLHGKKYKCDDVNLARSVIKRAPWLYNNIPNIKVQSDDDCALSALRGGFGINQDYAKELFALIWREALEIDYENIKQIPDSILTEEMIEYAAITRYLKNKKKRKTE